MAYQNLTERELIRLMPQKVAELLPNARIEKTERPASGMLWDLAEGIGTSLPGLPPPEDVGRMAWYHCIPGNLCGDERDELVLYNPWTTGIYVYTQGNSDEAAFRGFRAGPRQYNARLMD